MLHATRRLLSEPLHPLERRAALELLSLRGSAADAEALLPVLLAEPAANADLIDPVVRLGDAAMVRLLHDRFVDGERLVEGADPALLWAFGWAGLEDVRPMLFRYACEQNWDTAPAAVDGLVHLTPDGMESQVRAAVEACVGRNLFPEYLPALAGWIGDTELLDRFLVEDGRTMTPSTDCMAGVILGVGLLGPVGRSRLHDLFWASEYPVIWLDQPDAAVAAMRMTGLGIGALAGELRARAASTEGELPHWWFVIVEAMARRVIATRSLAPAWRFLPDAESPLQLHAALFGPNDLIAEDLGHLAFHRGGRNGEWLASQIHDLRAPIEDLIRRDALVAELDGYSGSTTTAVP